MPTKKRLALKRPRAEQVNQAIQIIADHGHRLFYSEGCQAWSANRRTPRQVGD